MNAPFAQYAHPAFRHFIVFVVVYFRIHILVQHDAFRTQVTMHNVAATNKQNTDCKTDTCFMGKWVVDTEIKL